MLDSLILLKLAALGCFGIIIIAIASFLRWIEEESYKNPDGPKTSTGMINDENKRTLLLPMYFSSTPSLEMQRPGMEEDEYTSSVKSGLDEPDTQNYPFRLNAKECDQITDSAGLTNTEDCVPGKYPFIH